MEDLEFFRVVILWSFAVGGIIIAINHWWKFYTRDQDEIVDDDLIIALLASIFAVLVLLALK